MSEGKFQNDILKYVTHSSFSLKEKAFELQTTRLDEEESNPALADDSLDDSSSSYCTALCSLSEYSEALEDETQTTCTDPPCENASTESSQSVAVSGRTLTNSSPKNTDLLQDLKTKQKDGKGTSQDVLSKELLYGQNKVSAKNPVLIESKQFSSSPKITILNVNLININTVDADQDSTPTSTPNPTPQDYFKKNATQSDTKPVQNVGSLEHKITPNTILTRSKGKYNQERNQEHSDIKPEEHPTTLQQSSRNDHYKPSTEFKLDSDESIIRKMKWEGEEQGLGVGKEQAELSLNAGNRKPPASCTSTLTANKQKSGILPRCYSKSLLATRNQHQSQSPPVSQRLKKQNGQGIGLSTSLPPTPCSSYRQHCSSADNTRGKFSMATKVAGTTTEVRGLAALEYTRSSCPETNYLDVLNSTCWSSTQQYSDRDFYDWSKDVFKVPVIPANNNNTSACSEASSFECIDVALENHEEVDRIAKTVPKRQIQLKRRDNVESHASEKDIIPSTPSRPRDPLQRQHSTPAAFHQDLHGSETKFGQTEQKKKLQKSLSLDETSSKTKMASCIIKNVLSKRMQHEQNLHSVDVPDQTFCPIKADGTVNNIDYLSSCAKEECTESNKVNLATVPLLSCRTSAQSPVLKTDSQTMSSIKEHISVSSKILPKLITKHSFNPLLGGLGRTQFQGSGTEIAAYSEAEEEKLSPSKEANQGSGEKLSCDSAKGKAWNLSAVTGGAVGKQATVKTTPEECVNVQASQKQHYVKDQPIEKQEKPGENKESTQSPTVSAWLACSLDAKIVDNVLSQSVECNLKKDQESGKGELRPPGQSVNMGIQSQGKFRAIAPVHVVRDMRSLVKNTYSLSFRGLSEAVQGLDDTVPSFATAAPHPVISKRENKVKGHKQDEKLHVPKATLPLALDTVMDLASLDTTSREFATQADSILESNDKIPHTGFTKVSPISAAQTNSCGLSKSPKAQDSQTAVSQTNVQCSNTYMKKTTCANMPIQAHKGTLTNTSENEQSADTRNPECEKPRNFAVHPTQPLATASLYCLPVESSDQQGSCKISNQVCSAEKDGQQTPGLPAKSQNSAGPPSACILTVAPAPVFPSYFYKPNLLGYQTISPNMGTVSYVQGPVLLQTPPDNQPATASGPVPLMKSLSVEGRLLSQPCMADGYPVQQESSKQMENGDTSQKMPSPDTQPCTAFITALGAEGIHGGASMLYPEMGGSQHVSNPRHMLLDPETGQCFYVDMPQLPQRKMLFDPETCQYVEVVVPQQTLSSTVMTTPCAIPFPSLHIPAMYTPHCLSYVQTHHRVLPPPEP
ncbi:uncharacterized protein prob1 [Pangasianodon hypophthalmus]|uniref:uncharacterized protein prob1 n=1 Tax=Pangasianodon hypophthalmus TaxID=310915 RepID=UPI0023077BA8|nr:uncharacterized protein prob1 [Pangasianodon hypophthalmus]XP_034167175.2 uncharacterized protein prob1 [Pangasianodon hypophthalmus]XP_034167176.2 uncharacterized protein prob1 [Pangasianodon hypophthalmus]XP_034167177.2 uncharacterized protein prob1 [Pangasianodon hypophthalmus]